MTASRALSALDGLALNTKDDFLRQPLENATGLPFSPNHYKVWRNYARVFQCAMIATQVSGRLVVTELCRNLASDTPLSPDEYLNFVFTHFQYPYPAFDNYDNATKPTFPFVAVIKYLVANHKHSASLDDIFQYVLGNDCTGMEEIAFYRTLQQTSRKPNGDEQRQVRELLVFMGQASYIRWFDKHLYLDTNDFDAVISATVPCFNGERLADASMEFLRLSSLKQYATSSSLDIELRDRSVSEFAVKEGRKAFASHQKIERSPLARYRYFKLHPTLVCDACALHPIDRYPWLHDTNILELHHILPLSATLNSNGTTTTLDDLKPLCPTCHRSIHAFYKQKLAEWELPDFSSRKMANDVYELAKKGIVA